MPPVVSQPGRKRRSLTRGDIRPIPQPDTTLAGWADDVQAVELLRVWAVGRTAETIAWYQRDKRPKRWESRLLRAAAVLLAVIGGALPLAASSVHGVNPNWGYVALALAAGCVAFDHFFGLSSGWMRDIASLQALQSRLTRFHLDWARWQAAKSGVLAGSDAEAGSTAAALDLIGGLITDVSEITESETAQWITDFTSSVAALRRDASPSVTSPQDLITWGSKSEPAAS